MENSIVRASLLRHLQHLRSRAADVFVGLVVNTKSSYSLAADYLRHSVTTEYLSERELQDILTSLRKNAFYVEVFLGEMSFLRELSAGITGGAAFPLKAIYATVPSGTWTGRDALIPAVCGAYGLPYCNCDAYVASLVANKYYMFTVLRSFGLPTPRTWLYQPREGWFTDRYPPLGLKVIAKPNFECASIGIDERSVLYYDHHADRHFAQLAHEFQQPFLVQEFITGWEVDVPVFWLDFPFAPAALGISIDNEKFIGDRFLHYTLIAADSYSYYNFDTCSEDIAARLRDVATRVYTCLRMAGVARVDFRIDCHGSIYVMDVNTPPHLARGSACEAAFRELDLSHADLLGTVIAGCLHGNGLLCTAS